MKLELQVLGVDGRVSSKEIVRARWVKDLRVWVVSFLRGRGRRGFGGGCLMRFRASSSLVMSEA